MIELKGDIDFSEYRQLQWKLHKAADVLSDMCEWAAITGAKAAVAYVKANPSWTPRTGKLAKGRARLLVRMRSKAVAQARWSAKYASFVDKGTKGHEIRPKFVGIGPVRKSQTRRKANDIGTHRIALRWMGADGWLFATRIWHPGTKPRPFEQMATDVAAEAALKVVEISLREVDRIFYG